MTCYSLLADTKFTNWSNFEIRNSKSETISKPKDPNSRNEPFSLRQFWILGFDHWNLFRISSFGFKAYATNLSPVCHDGFVDIAVPAMQDLTDL